MWGAVAVKRNNNAFEKIKKRLLSLLLNRNIDDGIKIN